MPRFIPVLYYSFGWISIAVNIAVRLKCNECYPQAPEQKTAIGCLYRDCTHLYNEHKLTLNTFSHTNICAPPTHTYACNHRHQPGNIQTEILNKGKSELAGPPANHMHEDHFQNRTKWWAIFLWLSGSPQGPCGRMACNCVRVPFE